MIIGQTTAQSGILSCSESLTSIITVLILILNKMTPQYICHVGLPDWTGKQVMLTRPLQGPHNRKSKHIPH